MQPAKQHPYPGALRRLDPLDPQERPERAFLDETPDHQSLRATATIRGQGYFH